MGIDKKNKKGFQLLTVLLVMITVTLGISMGVSSEVSVANNTPQIGVNGNYNYEEGATYLEWDSPDIGEPHTYQVYSKKPENTEFQSISTMDINEEVNILNVYPYIDVLTEWVDNYGLGKINLTTVHISEFREDPEMIWDYDGVVIGFVDGSFNFTGGESINEANRLELEKYVEEGRGLLLGHDTVYMDAPRRNYEILGNKYLDMTVKVDSSEWYNGHPTRRDTKRYGTSQIVITKQGLLTSYPHDIGEVGTRLTVPYVHTSYQIAGGDIWMRFYEDNMESDYNFYLTTKNNVAMLQTGHAVGSDSYKEEWATPDEQMLVINTIFYLTQLTEGTDTLDRSAMDVYPPEFVSDKVEVKRTNENIKISYPEAVDPDKKFEYYVKSIGKGSGVEHSSEVITIDQLGEMSGYSYKTDNEPDTTPDNIVDTQSLEITLPNDRNQGDYFHISAVDTKGNVSDPLHVDLRETYYQVDGNLFMDSNADGIRGADEPWIENHEVTLTDADGKEFLDIRNRPYKTVTDSNGYFRFDVFTGGQMRLKVTPKEDRRFTAVPDSDGRQDVYNQVTDPNEGLTDIFTINEDIQKVTRNAGFTYIELSYEVEHINKQTGNRIVQPIDGQIDGITSTESTLRPLDGDNLPLGYNYLGEYSVNGGSIQDGNSFKLDYDDYMQKVSVKFYYDFTGVNNTTKRFQGDDLTSPNPLDSYTNAGLYTQRGLDSNITETGLTVNASFILSEQEAPIGIRPTSLNMQLLDEGNNKLGETVKTVSDTMILNDTYLDTLRVKSQFGGSSNETEPVRLGNFTTNSVNLSHSDIENIGDIRNQGLEDTDAELNTSEDTNYIGRWVNQPLDITGWSPSGIGGISTTITGEDAINRAKRIETTYTMEIYNILQHNYTLQLDSNGIEVYQYQDTTLLQGYYPYNSSGVRQSGIKGENSTFSQTSYVGIEDIEVGSYINADGFQLEDATITPIQRQVGVEVFDGGGQTITESETDNIEVNGVSTVDNLGNLTQNNQFSGREIINYYEELAYLPFSQDESLITHQAVPVGGRLLYVNPYDYATLPSYRQQNITDRSYNTLEDVRVNAQSYYNTGRLNSEVAYTTQHTGLYVSEVDDYEQYEQSFATTSEENLNYMDNMLQGLNEYKPYKTNTTLNYIDYMARNNSSIYSQRGEVQGSTSLKYRLPLTYVHNINEVMLEDVIAVGTDTGYPVYGSYDSLTDLYKQNYLEDIGNKPSVKDKLITSNKGSIYLLPIQKQGQTLDSSYQIREFINKIGISQLSLVNEKTYTADKYLYGRGNNVIYTGIREELDNNEDSFISEQVITSEITKQQTKPVNGIRTGNNSGINNELLPEEVE